MKNLAERNSIFKANDPIMQAIFSACQGQINEYTGLLEQIKKQSQGREKLSSWYLARLAKDIAGQVQDYGSTEERLRAKFLSITNRNGMKNWNTAAAAREFLRHHYPAASITSTIPRIKQNLLKNPDFETVSSGVNWTLSNANIVGGKKSFQGSSCLNLNANGRAVQTLAGLDAGNYAFRFAHQGGSVEVSIKQGSQFWNPNGNISKGLPQGQWGATSHKYGYPASPKWQLHTLFFQVATQGDTVVEIADTSTAGGSIRSYIDYTELGTYHSPSIIYIVRIEGDGTIGNNINNLYVANEPYYRHAFQDNVFNEGLDAQVTATAAKEWLKIIAAAGVDTAITILSGKK